MKNNIRNILLEAIESEDQSNINDAFYKWFRDSKVVDSKGNPLIVYHGNPVNWGAVPEFDVPEFTEFDTPAYFTDNKLMADSFGESRPFYISAKNPLYIDSWDDIDEDDLYETDYDAIFATEDDELWVIVKNPTQIKSIYNQGKWNTNNKDFMK